MSQTIFTIMKGSSFRPQADRDVYDRVTPGQVLLLERDPTNQHDKNAIRVLTESKVFIAHVAKEEAVHVAALLDAGIPCTCRCVGRPRIEIEFDMPGSEEDEVNEGDGQLYHGQE